MTWPDAIAALGGSAAFLLAAAWLIKALVMHGMNNQAESFKASLKSQADAELERLKSSLQIENEQLKHGLEKTALEHQVRFSKLHERRAETIAEAYKLLLETSAVVQNYVLHDPKNKEQEAFARTKAFEFYRYIQLNRIYLPSLVCQSLDRFDVKMRSIVAHVGAWWADVGEPTPQTVTERNKVLLDAVTALEVEFPTLKAELEKTFRALLGGE